jgi:GTP cyclohydrolase I
VKSRSPRAGTAPSPEEQVIGFERVARSAEALQRLKPQERLSRPSWKFAAAVR